MTFVLRALIFLASAALGLLLAALLVPGFHIEWSHGWGFVLAIVLFAVVQSIVAPLATRIAKRRAPLLLGGIGIVATFVSIVVVVLIPHAGLGISTLGAWFLGPLVVWIVSALATWLLTSLLVARPAAESKKTRR
jgi:hypothetical protein